MDAASHRCGGPQGRLYSFVPAEVAHFKNDPVGQMRTLAAEPGRDNVEAVAADIVAIAEVTSRLTCCGCTYSTTISTPR
jgi:predicted methyltransferase